MFKVTERGIEDDGCIELTDDDLLEIKKIFEESALPLNGGKNDGMWTQQTAFTNDTINDEGNCI